MMTKLTLETLHAELAPIQAMVDGIPIINRAIAVLQQDMRLLRVALMRTNLKGRRRRHHHRRCRRSLAFCLTLELVLVFGAAAHANGTSHYGRSQSHAFEAKGLASEDRTALNNAAAKTREKCWKIHDKNPHAVVDHACWGWLHAPRHCKIGIPGCGAEGPKRAHDKPISWAAAAERYLYCSHEMARQLEGYSGNWGASAMDVAISDCLKTGKMDALGWHGPNGLRFGE